jgi:hypothetical protein
MPYRQWRPPPPSPPRPLKIAVVTKTLQQPPFLPPAKRLCLHVSTIMFRLLPGLGFAFAKAEGSSVDSSKTSANLLYGEEHRCCFLSGRKYEQRCCDPKDGKDGGGTRAYDCIRATSPTQASDPQPFELMIGFSTHIVFCRKVNNGSVDHPLG